jgi:TolA-binding protein
MRNLVGCTLLLFVAAVLSYGQSDSGAEDGVNFRGVVRYQNNTPAAFVQVELWTDGETTWRTFAMTDRQGKFHTGAPCMVVKYRVRTPGYRQVEGQVDISIQPCRALESITLRALPGTTVPGSGPPPTVTAPGNIDARIAGIPADAKKEFDEGQRAINGNDFSGSIPHLQKAITIYPRYAEAYQLLAVSQLQTRQAPQAEASLLKAIEIEDRMPRAQYLLGALYAMTGRVQLAEKPLNRFAELDPQNPDAYFELAKVNFALSKFPDAETQAKKSIDLKESNHGVYIVLGYALLRQSKADAAEQAFQNFVAQDPNSAVSTDVKKMIAEIDQHKR